MDLEKLKKEYENCPCGRVHEFTTKVIKCESGLVKRVGKELREAGFPRKILFMADENTLSASSGILESLDGFDIKEKIYDDLRVADMRNVQDIEKILQEVDGVVACGTGSLHDTARLACARQNKELCLFATAPSMDGFASNGAPTTDGNFKTTILAKCPEVILADNEILARSPAELKSAGFGDMIGKYVGLIDWEVSTLLTGEYWCDKVAGLTRQATDEIFALCDRVTLEDEETAGEIFEALLKTGIGMSFTKTSRPASGTEHILSHFWECKKLLDGEISDFHGKKVGVATLLIMEEYERLAGIKSVHAHPEKVDWEEVKEAYGELYPEVEKLNFPVNIIDSVKCEDIDRNWDKIRQIILNVPSLSEMKDAMRRAGCALTNKDIAVSDELKEQGLEYHPYMRARLSLYRLRGMIK